MKILTSLCILILILLGVSFSLLNASSVSVNYLLGTSVLPVSFLIIISAAVGAIISLFFCLLGSLRQKASIHHLKKKVESLEKELNSSSTSSTQ